MMKRSLRSGRDAACLGGSKRLLVVILATLLSRVASAGAIDWTKAFSILADARFTGPISIHMDYAAKDSPNAARNDLEFVRKHVQQAWAAAQKS